MKKELIRGKMLGTVLLWGSTGKCTRVPDGFGRHHLLEQQLAVSLRDPWWHQGRQ